MQTKGQHVTADVWCNEYDYTNAEYLCATLAECIAASGLTILGYKLHEFNKEGAFTCVWVLGESHFSIHTFPERNFFSMDCYTCGENGKPLQAIAEALSYFDVKKSKIRVLERG